MNNSLPSFWRWFCYGSGGRAGFRRVLSGWLLLHLTIGVVLSFVVDIDIAQIAEKALFPLMAIFVGLTFSWAGNSHSLLQSPEVIRLAASRSGGIAEYVFTFQLCILILLITICCWILPALKMPYLIPGGWGLMIFNACSEALLYALVSLSLRTSWQAVLGANMLLLSRAEMMRRDRNG